MIKLTLLIVTILGVLATSWAHLSTDNNDAYHTPEILKGTNPHQRMVPTENNVPEEEKRPEFWYSLARNELLKNIEKKKLNNKKAKNIILFLGDGMSVSTLTAARILKGQRKNQLGEGELLSFEKFPYTALSRIYCADSQIPDSACTSTAYLCGVKGNIMTIGVSANVSYNDCAASSEPINQVSSIAAWAQKAGKSTGFITTTTLVHASPSGLYAHVANRQIYSDAEVLKYGIDPSKCKDIAQQLITEETGRNFNVMLGGGMRNFLPNTTMDPHGNYGFRLDGKNLLSKWQAIHPSGVLVTNRDQLLNVNLTKTSHLMGLFQSGHMDYNLKADKTKQPSLSEMTEKALKILQSNDKGYFIFIEGGNIDTAHHETWASLALDETLEMEKAVQLARDLTDPNETLIVVTADHGHPLTISGYSDRGSPILGLSKASVSLDGLKFSTLNYPLGPEQYINANGGRLNLEQVLRSVDSPYPSYIKTADSHHSGEDVAVFAHGPHDYLFTGVLQENTIPHIMAYAACIGDGPKMCDEVDEI